MDNALNLSPNSKASLLLPEWIIPIRPARQVLKNHALLIEGNRISEVGPADGLLKKYPGLTPVKLNGHVLMPGLINLHSHAAMSLMRGLADDLPLERWLNEKIWPAEMAVMSPEFVFDGSSLAALEMLKGGVTCFNDMYFFPDATARAALSLGMRAQLGIVVFEFPSKYGSGPDDYLSKGLALRDSLRGEDLINFCLAPHAPYTVSDESFKKVRSYADELELPIHCHIHETAFEVQQSTEQFGKRPIERLRALGLVGPQLIAVHAVHLSEPEIALFAQNGVHVAHCPHSNMKLASGFCPTTELLQAGVNLGIGTDGSASNNRLDLWSEGRTAALLAKGFSGNAANFDAFAILEALTLAPARALGKQAELGSLEPGKLADLIAIDLSSLDNQPVFHPEAQLAYLTGRDDVKEVWINGQHVVHKRQLTSSEGLALEQRVQAASLLWQNTLGEIQSRSPGLESA